MHFTLAPPPSHTTHTVPSAPRNVSVFTEVVVWGPPQSPNGIIIGYEVKFSGSLSGSVSVTLVIIWLAPLLLPVRTAELGVEMLQLVKVILVLLA